MKQNGIVAGNNFLLMKSQLHN